MLTHTWKIWWGQWASGLSASQWETSKETKTANTFILDFSRIVNKQISVVYTTQSGGSPSKLIVSDFFLAHGMNLSPWNMLRLYRHYGCSGNRMVLMDLEETEHALSTVLLQVMFS